MVNKKRIGNFWKILIFIVLLILIISVTYLFTYKNNKDPENLIPNRNPISGKVILDRNALTTSELSGGVSLDSGWNIFIWNNDLTENLRIESAFTSILENIEYAYSYNLGTFYFNPDGNYASYIDHEYYGARPLKEIVPGHKYGVFLKSEDILTFGENSNDPGELLIILPDGTQINPNTGEIITIINDNVRIETFSDVFSEGRNSNNPITIEGASCSDGDVDQSRLSLGRIDFGDVVIFSNCFGKSEPNEQCVIENFNKLDFDNDDYIGRLDLSFFGNCFGQSV